eukprot:4710694-Amphidinium_carterae.2
MDGRWFVVISKCCRAQSQEHDKKWWMMEGRSVWDHLMPARAEKLIYQQIRLKFHCESVTVNQLVFERNQGPGRTAAARREKSRITMHVYVT